MTPGHDKTEQILWGSDGTFTGLWTCTCGEEFDSEARRSELDAQAAIATSWGMHLRGL